MNLVWDTGWYEYVIEHWIWSQSISHYTKYSLILKKISTSFNYVDQITEMHSAFHQQGSQQGYKRVGWPVDHFIASWSIECLWLKTHAYISSQTLLAFKTLSFHLTER